MAQFLYSFKFNENNYIFEIKYTNLPADVSKEKKYQWFLFENQTMEKLKFVSMDGDTRTFQNCFLDMNEKLLTIDGSTYPIEPFDCSNIVEICSQI